jgi:hypothetical protein
VRSTIHLLGVAFHFLPAGGGSKLSPISEMGFPGQAGGYFAPYNNDFEDAPKGEYLTERLTSEAIGFLQDHAKNQSEKPFLLCVSHYAVHMPIEAKPEDVGYFEKKLETIDYGSTPTDRNRTSLLVFGATVILTVISKGFYLLRHDATSLDNTATQTLEHSDDL